MCLLTTCGKLCGIPSGGIRRVFGVTWEALIPYGNHHLRPLNPYGNHHLRPLNPYGNVLRSCDLSEHDNIRPQKSQDPSQKISKS